MRNFPTESFDSRAAVKMVIEAPSQVLGKIKDETLEGEVSAKISWK